VSDALTPLLAAVYRGHEAAVRGNRELAQLLLRGELP